MPRDLTRELRGLSEATSAFVGEASWLGIQSFTERDVITDGGREDAEGELKIDSVFPETGSLLDQPRLGQTVSLSANVAFRGLRSDTSVLLTFTIRQGGSQWGPVDTWANMDMRAPPWTSGSARVQARFLEPGPATIHVKASAMDHTGSQVLTFEAPPVSVSVQDNDPLVPEVDPLSATVPVRDTGGDMRFYVRIRQWPHVQVAEFTLDDWATIHRLQRLPHDVTQWSGNAWLAPDTKPYTAKFRCFDYFSRETPVAVSFRTVDETRPRISVGAPSEDQVIVQETLPWSSVVWGHAEDLQTGIQAITWSLDGQSFSPISLGPNGDFSFPIELTEYGLYTLTIRARDGSDHQVEPEGRGNPVLFERQFELVSGYKPKTLDELLGPRAYLDDLLRFVTAYFRQPDGTEFGALVDTNALTNLLFQPFGRLRDVSSDRIGNAPIGRLRVPVETLRHYLATGPARLLVGHWRCDETSGTLLGDSGPNQNHGTLAGGASWGAGRMGGAVMFDGADSIVEIPPGSPRFELGRGNADFTVAFWLNLTEGFTGEWRRIMQKGNHDTFPEPERTFALFVHPDSNRIHFRISTTGPVENRNDGGDSTSELLINAWSHLAYVKTDNLLKLYIDGRLDAEVRLKGETISNTGPIFVGRAPWWGRAIKGGIDDLRIYGLALSESTVEYLAQGRPNDALPARGATEEGYLQTAYETLLTQIGTSYAELRLARTASYDERKALATRLGLDAANPDQVTNLLPPENGLTEGWLEDVFGLSDTSRPDPLRPRLEDPRLLKWQQGALDRRWENEDHPSIPPADRIPILEPDLVDLRDLKQATTDDPVYRLLTRRQGWLVDREREIRDKVDGAGSAKAAFAAVTAFVLGPDVDLDALGVIDRTGQSIATDLKSARLTWTGFRRLQQVRAIAAKDENVTATEWDDVCQILLQVSKERHYAVWADEERGVLLSPQSFALSDHEPIVRPWRASAAARSAWQSKLQDRIAALAVLRKTLHASVAATEELALPLLRDALVSRLADADIMPQIADELSQRLLLDIGHRGVGSTTRVMQAIETLQELVNAVRNSRLPSEHPASSWTYLGPGDEVEDFDETWATIGRHAGWQAAMRVFLYPENTILPNLLYEPSRAFKNLCTELRTNVRLEPQQARNLATAYSKALRAEEPSFPLLHQLELTDQLSPEQLYERKKQNAAIKAESVGDHFIKREKIFFVPVLLAMHLQRAGYYDAALDWLRTIYAFNLAPERRKIFYKLEDEQNTAPSLEREVKRWARTRELNPHVIARKRPNPYTRFTLTTIAQCLVDYANSNFTTDISESVATARALYLLAQDLLHAPELGLMPPTKPEQALLPNPIIETLRTRVETQLAKLRSGRNIAGMRRALELLAAPAVRPVSAAADVARLSPPRPTPYRYPVLIERCKQLVAIAQQVEAAYLTALERRDQEAEKLRREEFAAEIGEAKVELQSLQTRQALDNTELALRQRARSEIAKSRYDEWLAAGPNEYENQQIYKLNEAQVWSGSLALAETDAAMASFWSSWAGMAGGQTGFGLVGAFAALGGGLSFTIDQNAIAKYRILAGEAATSAQIAGLNASQERRMAEWKLQSELAHKDMLIGDQQIVLAKDQVAIARQELVIAGKQRDHDRAMVDFLITKFMSVELYDWMVGVLGEIYGFFLQQATASAQLAQVQLAFERQESPFGFIKTDYWKSPVQPGTSSQADRADRRGLTGSARLLEDIHRLDQHAFVTDRRRLNLTQTFSLARSVPYEFASFKETGILGFETPMRLFDERFPGHYMRVIKQVRVTLVALVPPSEGICATLSATGSSHIVVGPDVFTPVILHRDPPQVSLTSPVGATGVFELDPQPDLLRPFEGMGVHARWQFELPKAANPFDYRTISDLLITIEYTALHSYDYREEVIRTLDPEIGGERTFSIRDNLPDAWYDLNNPGQATTPWQIRFETTRSDFPPNLVNTPKIREILVYVVSREGTEAVQGDLTLTYQPTGGVSIGPLMTRLREGIVSTRRSDGNATWGMHVRSEPATGTWTVVAMEDPQNPAQNLRRKLRAGEVEDILIAVTFSGQRPPWPNI